jgi:hypothetical protein
MPIDSHHEECSRNEEEEPLAKTNQATPQTNSE